MFLDLNSLKNRVVISVSGKLYCREFPIPFFIECRLLIMIWFLLKLGLYSSFLVYTRRILAFVTTEESNILSMTRKLWVSVELWPLIRPALNNVSILKMCNSISSHSTQRGIMLAFHSEFNYFPQVKMMTGFPIAKKLPPAITLDWQCR